MADNDARYLQEGRRDIHQRICSPSDQKEEGGEEDNQRGQVAVHWPSLKGEEKENEADALRDHERR